MQAVVKIAPQDGPGGTEVRECPDPVALAGEVVVRVAAAAICGTDKHIYHWDPSIRDSVVPPRIYGHEFCGFVESIGPSQNTATSDPEIKVGDYVSAEMHVVCGRCLQCRTGNGHICARTKILGLHEDGAFAELVKVPASNLIRLDKRYVPLHIGAFLDAMGNAVHSTQVVDLAGKSVLVTGFGPIGAMAAAIAEHSGARAIFVNDVSENALETARKWAARRDIKILHTLNARTSTPEAIRKEVDELTDGGVDVVLEMSGAPTAINLGLSLVRMGGFVSLLGLPTGHSVTIDDYTRNIIFKGITVQGIIGRRMYSTWERMLALLESGLDVDWIVQAKFDGLEAFQTGMEKFDRHEALKVVFFPEGEAEAKKRLK